MRLMNALRRRIGFTVTRFPLPNTIDHHLAHLLRQRSIDPAIDVGAHRGEFGQGLRLAGFPGYIISFDPVPQPDLKAAAQADGRWQIRPVAVGAETSSVELFEYPSTDFNSLHRTNGVGRDRFGQMPTTTRTVDVVRLDDENVGGTSLMLKSDTQGHDLAVLAGASETLRRVAIIQVEAAVTPIYDDAPMLGQVVEELSSLGFGLTGVFPVSRHRDRLRIVEVDCTFVRVAD